MNSNNLFERNFICVCELNWKDPFLYSPCSIHDKHGRKRVELLSREELLDEALAYMIHNDFHSLDCYSDGDGWNEPYSEGWTCGCDVNDEESDLEHHWEGFDWVQIDPKCSNRPSNDEVYRSWIKHVREEQEYFG